jgi:glutathione S-transferase
MTDQLTLHGFGVNDRSGKVRWLAHELGLPLEDCRVKPGEHRRAPYTDLNPYGMIPAVQWRGQTFIESTATCTFLAEQFPDSGIVVAPGEPDRASYLQWCALFAETLESRLVEHLLAKVEILPAAFLETTTPSLDLRLPVMLGQLPESGFLAADRFTLADIEASYSLRLAISAGLLELDAVGGYLRPLMERPAAQAAKFFSSIEPKE